MQARAVILTLITGLLFGCDKKPVESLSPATVVGSYAGQYENGSTESFAIRLDGTFSQSLSNGGSVVYFNEGRWQLNQTDVILSNVFLGVDVWKLHAGKPAKVDSFRAHWNPHGPAIVFSEDEHYWVEKQVSKP
jgi:hypothetical protein